VAGKRVAREMDQHLSLKGYEQKEIAEKIASRKFPRANPLIISEIRCKRRKK
jgi:hypothetical protein